MPKFLTQAWNCKDPRSKALDPSTSSSAAEAVSFFQAWLRNPLRIAAIAPSGSALAGLITAEISAETGPVIELGPGTGSFTRALISRGVLQSELALIEFEPRLATSLRLRYPRATVLQMDASRLSSIKLFDQRPAGAVVSGLPLLSMAPRQTTKILAASFSKMQPGGAFYQFTYGFRCPVPTKVLNRLNLKAERIGWVFSNLPPAAVYRLSRPTTDSALGAS
ncbi:Phospholipid N-methyltransferase [Rhizobium sp. NFR07]|uniref:class I SAM-dependent methyltransferase n=1 Tax=Rhizobium sp. NFR07 TaxID=1566262 RepID=UPI0008F21641|nr:phospholipid methyltransferase [Rhizobium sp. NFR07]SFB61703.1 Phospholipid N-methyltransferase [Rhizobium sp. NFR07]